MRITREHRYVVLKIGSAKHARTKEYDFAQMVFQDPNRQGKTSVCRVMSMFEHQGFNGKHVCFVLEPLGRTLQNLMNKQRSAGYDHTSQLLAKFWPLSFTRQVSKQLTLGLDCLHRNQIMHRDIHLGNILFGLNFDIDGITESEIQESRSYGGKKYDSGKYHLSRKGGTPLQEWDPPYLVEPSPLDDGVSIEDPSTTESFRVVLTDLGAASTFENSNDGEYRYPRPLRSPEVILRHCVDFKADIFNLGCLIFEIVTMKRLFPVNINKRITEELIDQHLKMIIQRLGPIPPALRSEWLHADQFIDENGELLGVHQATDPGLTLRNFVMQCKPYDMGANEVEAFVDFLTVALRPDQTQRASTSDLLNHRWLTEFAR